LQPIHFFQNEILNTGDQPHLQEEKDHADLRHHVTAVDTEKGATHRPIVTEGRLLEEIVVDQGEKLVKISLHCFHAIMMAILSRSSSHLSRMLQSTIQTDK